MRLRNGWRDRPDLIAGRVVLDNLRLRHERQERLVKGLVKQERLEKLHSTHTQICQTKITGEIGDAMRGNEKLFVNRDRCQNSFGM